MSVIEFTPEEARTGRFRGPVAMLHGPTSSTERTSPPTIDLSDKEVLELLNAGQWEEYVALKKLIFALINEARRISI
ncbi:MAG: hypothetical protein GXX95_00945 [Methanomassiliicoccus sp.]|nr:hypothetical protein [Methanomassiliicoccus sp.]